MLVFLVAVRNILIAAALSWVGVSLESREPASAPACADSACNSPGAR